MRIGIDARYLSHASVGGVHTYVANFVPALIEIAHEHQIYLYADTKCPFELRALPNQVTVRFLPYRNPLSSVYNDFFAHRQMARDQLDLAHFPGNYGFGPAKARTVITLHDAINILPWREIVRGHTKHPRTISMMTYLHFCSRAALRQAHLVITVSDYAKSEIAKHSTFDRRRIWVVPEAPAPGLRRIEDANVLNAVRLRHRLPGAFVLADALKNPATLVNAWRLLPDDLRARCTLVFFARTPNVLPIVHEAIRAGHARLLIRPSWEDLVALYSMAEAFVFPSWIEGFGLPVLEAMTCGAPVIASKRGAIPQVAGNAARLADAQDANAFAQHLTCVLANSAEAQSLRERGFERAAQFSWHKTAQQTLACYEQAML